MREEISLIDEYDRACHGRAYAEFSDADHPEPRGWRDNWPYAVPGLVALALLLAAGVALAAPPGIHALGPRMMALPAADDCIARVEVFNLSGWYQASETVETDAGPVTIRYQTVGGHNASDHDNIEVTSTPPGTAARPTMAQIRDGESLIVCIIDYVGA